LSSQVVPSVAGFWTGLPLLQAATVQSRASGSGTSVLSLMVDWPPLPSHATTLQSFGVWPLGSAVPEAVFVVPQTFVVQAAGLQNVPPVQSPATTH